MADVNIESDRADFVAHGAWKEMDEFLSRCEAEGPSQTTETRESRKSEFLTLLRQCHERTLEIFKRADRGDPRRVNSSYSWVWRIVGVMRLRHST